MTIKKEYHAIRSIDQLSVGDTVTGEFIEFDGVSTVSGTVTEKDTTHAIVTTEDGLTMWLDCDTLNGYGVTWHRVTEREETTQDRITAFCERYGVCEYHTEGNTMVFYSSFPMEHVTMRCVVDLETMEETRTELKGYYRPYKSRIGGRYVAEYCL